MKITTCYGCNKKKKLNSRHYCMTCWNKHQALVPRVAKKLTRPIKLIKRFSLQGLKETMDCQTLQKKYWKSKKSANQLHS